MANKKRFRKVVDQEWDFSPFSIFGPISILVFSAICLWEHSIDYIPGVIVGLIFIIIEIITNLCINRKVWWEEY